MARYPDSTKVSLEQRLRPGPRTHYVGSASQWQFAMYRASYDESVSFTGPPVGTRQDAVDTACGLYLNDPTVWTQHPTKLWARPSSLPLP